MWRCLALLAPVDQRPRASSGNRSPWLAAPPALLTGCSAYLTPAFSLPRSAAVADPPPRGSSRPRTPASVEPSGSPRSLGLCEAPLAVPAPPGAASGPPGPALRRTQAVPDGAATRRDHARRGLQAAGLGRAGHNPAAQTVHTGGCPSFDTHNTISL